MRVLVTGSEGFIGKNLCSHLAENENIEIVTFNKEDTFDKIESNIDRIDFIFHFAGVNRPQTVEEFYEGNSDLTKRLVDLIKDKNIPLLFTSSIQAALDNDYGKSKRIAEDYIKENLKEYYVFRLHNVFGKWCRPNYNSVVATFCDNIAHDREISIDDPDKQITLVYIDDVVDEFIRVLNGQKPEEVSSDGFCYANPRYEVTLKYLADKLFEFKKSMESILVPDTGNDFVKKLFSTFVSYVDLDKMVFAAEKHSDERGAFVELVKTKESGQFSVSYSKPGVVRGNHYHHTKIERFMVIKGKARINFSSIFGGDKISFEVDDKNIKVVTIPVGYTHNIENVGDGEMILMIWCNEIFDEKHPDTFYKKVEE